MNVREIGALIYVHASIPQTSTQRSHTLTYRSDIPASSLTLPQATLILTLPYFLTSTLNLSYLLFDLLRVGLLTGLEGLRVVDRVVGLTVVRRGCAEVFLF